MLSLILFILMYGVPAQLLQSLVINILLYLMKSRSELFTIFCHFCSKIHTQFGCFVSVLCSDNAKEYFSEPFLIFMNENGMLHQSSCILTPQQNGVAEHKNLPLMKVSWALLFAMKVSKLFLANAILTAAYLINRMSSSILNGVIPHSVLFPSHSLLPLPLKIFGCTCFVYDVYPQETKLDPKSLKCARGLF